MSKRTFVNHGTEYTDADIMNLGKRWEGIVYKAVKRILPDPAWKTEILDDLLKDFSANRIKLDSTQNVDGYIYRAAVNRAKNLLKRKILRWRDANCGVDDLDIYADENGKSPNQHLQLESHGEILDLAFQELVKVIRKNGHLPDPELAVKILRAYLLGASLRDLAKRFHLRNMNYPAMLKHRYLPVLRDIIRKIA